VKTDELIRELQNSTLYAECTCGEEFKLSEALIFDGTKPFPPKALEAQAALKEELKGRETELKRRMKSATQNALTTARAVNIGKKVEVLLPTMKDFRWSLPDCRFLGDPVDLLTFNGCSKGKICSMSFIEIKTGSARLNAHQKA